MDILLKPQRMSDYGDGLRPGNDHRLLVCAGYCSLSAPANATWTFVVWLVVTANGRIFGA
jgi:hypothetical protein